MAPLPEILPRAKRIRPHPASLSSLVAAVMLLASGEAADAGRTARDGLDRAAIEALVVEEATRMGVPVSLALAVAHAESSFDPNALSHKGARGVMQIMPKTALGEYGIGPELLWNPRINVRLGLHFLKRLLWRYRGRTDLALSYYNGGSAVGDLPHARVIPATALYVERVERLRRRYSGRLARR
ncbi:MAG: lytic transglycosylase domain-containing protein [Alphaproteobacteria bacterium]